MAAPPKIDSSALRLAKSAAAERVSSVVRVSRGEPTFMIDWKAEADDVPGDGYRRGRKGGKILKRARCTQKVSITRHVQTSASAKAGNGSPYTITISVIFEGLPNRFL